MKGRLSSEVRKCPVFIVKEETPVGILGAEECAYREILIMQ